MQIDIEAKPSYGMAVVTLGKGERITAESSSMVAMSRGLSVDTHFNGAGAGGLVDWVTAAFVGLVRKFLAGETMFVNTYTATQDGQQVMLAPGMVGDVVHIPLDGKRKVTVQASSYLASTTGVKSRLVWGGLSMLFGGEGAFFFECSGTGELLINSYGGIEEIPIDGGYIIDSGHVVAWEGGLQYAVRKAGGFKSAMLGGEGLVLEFKGKGTVWMQTRNVSALVGWISPFFRG